MNAFQHVFGKEKAGQVRCYGRNVTPTSLMKAEDIESIKKEHSKQMQSMQQKLDRVQAILQAILQQNPHIKVDANVLAHVIEGYANQPNDENLQSCVSISQSSIHKVFILLNKLERFILLLLVSSIYKLNYVDHLQIKPYK